MDKESYSQKLLDPRWQKKRLEILKRDNYTCQWCDDQEYQRQRIPLEVHHIKYQNGLMPWEYPNDQLITVCDICHELHHLRDNSNKKRLKNEIKNIPTGMYHISQVIDIVMPLLQK